MTDLLNPNNHDLFNHVRLRLIARNPVIAWEDIAAEFGVDDPNEMIAWFLSYRLPPAPRAHTMPEGLKLPRDPELRAEYFRLCRREESLLTVVNEAPRQLATVQQRIGSLERVR